MVAAVLLIMAFVATLGAALNKGLPLWVGVILLCAALAASIYRPGPR